MLAVRTQVTEVGMGLGTRLENQEVMMQANPTVSPQVTKPGIPEDCQWVMNQVSTTVRHLAIARATSQVLQQASCWANLQGTQEVKAKVCREGMKPVIPWVRKLVRHGGSQQDCHWDSNQVKPMAIPTVKSGAMSRANDQETQWVTTLG
jgi:hypothetical protein